MKLGLLGPEQTTRLDAPVAKAVGEVRPPGIAEHSVTTALVPRERVQQRTADKIGDVPQCRKETCEQIGVIEVPETASQDRRL